ncbi:MAG: Ku protein [Thermoplasmata archaeon]
MPRPIWKGAISFGLVHIPVQLEMAVHERTVRFHMMSKDGTCRLRRKLYCPDTGKEFNFEDTARGIEISKGDYVILDEDEIKRLRPESGRAIEISQFVELADLDPIYFDRAYFVVPVEGSSRPYKLLYEAMRKSGKIAVAQFVMRERQYLCAIRVLEDGLVLHTLDYVDEVASIDESLPSAVGSAKLNSKEVEVAVQLVDSMTRQLDLSEYHDKYREDLEKLVQRRKKGEKVKIEGNAEDKPLPRTVNLIDALRRSLRSSGPVAAHAQGRHVPRKAGARRPRSVHRGRKS